jgi:hypothetical protein
MSRFDDAEFETFDDDALRSQLRSATSTPKRDAESMLEELMPRFRAQRRKYVATRASAAASAIVAGVLVVASLHGSSSAKGMHIDTRPAGEPTVSVPSRAVPHPEPSATKGAQGPSSTTAPSSAARGQTGPTPTPRSTVPTPLPHIAPVFTLPPSNATPPGNGPKSGGGSGSVPSPTTPGTQPSTSSTVPPTTTTTTPASGTQIFVVKNGTVVFGTVQVSWVGPALTFDNASPTAGFTFVESQGDPNEVDVTFTRTSDGAQAHLHLEMQSQPSWHPIVD